MNALKVYIFSATKWWGKKALVCSQFVPLLGKNCVCNLSKLSELNRIYMILFF